MSAVIIHRRGEGDAAVRGVGVRIAVHRNVGVQIHRAGEGDVAVVALVGRAVEVDVRARHGDHPSHGHRAQIDLPTAYRQAGELRRAADGALEVHGAGACIKGQRLRPGGRRVDRRGEGDVAVRAVIVRVAVHRHVRMQVHRAGEGDVAVVAVVGGAVQVDVRARHRDRARRRHRVQVDLSAGHRQARQCRRAAHRALQVHRSRVRVQHQRIAAIDRRGGGEGDAAVGPVAVGVRVDRDVGAQHDRPTERNRGVVDRDVALQRNRASRRQRQRAAQRDRRQADVGGGDGEVVQLVRAPDRALEVHAAGVRIEGQRLRAGGVRIHRRGEGDVAVGVVLVLVAVHAHVGVQVHRAGEGDVAVVAPIGRPVEVDVHARHGDRARRRHRVQVDLTAGSHRQAGELGRAPDGTLKIHSPIISSVQRQRISPVHRRGEGDVAEPDTAIGTVRAHVGMQIDRAGEGDVADTARVGRPVQVDVRALDVDTH